MVSQPQFDLWSGDVDRLDMNLIRVLALTAPASRERVSPIVFRPPAGATRVDVTSAFGAEDGRKRIGDRTRRAASTQVT